MAGELRVLDYLLQRRISTAFTILLILFMTVESASAVTLMRSLQTPAGDKQQQQVVRPGSSPPMCKSKCGHCSPCKAVHVAIHPGITVPLEYYPEAWRCKCGSNLFMPSPTSPLFSFTLHPTSYV